MASAFTPHRFKSLDRVSHIFFVEEKIITRAPPPWAPCISCSTFAKVLSLSRGLFMTTTFCVISWLALRLSTSPTFSFQGDLINSLARARTSFGHVAVNNKVCRFGGIEEITLRIWGSNPMSNILSASSSTKNETASSRTCLPSRKSFNRPGVAITTVAPCRISESWGPFGAPPYTQAVFSPEDWKNFLVSSWIWVDSSRVGAMTTTLMSRAYPPVCSIRRVAGTMKPRVFPLPVLATPIRSYPFITMGQAWAWIGDGALNPARCTSLNTV
mmetsp:Transcript_1643/g.3614  ORF Transcript_1643/g.3614 Transcript_1643/m.3614 type:complete len:271 (-) Transcript_1643:382-1194(-)